MERDEGAVHQDKGVKGSLSVPGNPVVQEFVGKAVVLPEGEQSLKGAAGGFWNFEFRLSGVHQ
jgi:hypothetical protein